MKRLHAARLIESVQLLELLLVLACMGAMLAALLPYVPRIMAKARLADALMQAGTYRVALMEQMALTGDGYPVLSAEDARQGQDNIDAEIGRKVTAPGFSTDRTRLSGDDFGGGAATGNKAKRDLGNKQAFDKFGKLEAAIVDQDIVFTGTLGTDNRKFFLRFTPSVIADETPGNVLWLCGQRKALPGWTQPASLGSDLPAELLFSTCR